MTKSEQILQKLNNFINREIDRAIQISIFHNEDGSYELFNSFFIEKHKNKFVVTKKTSFLQKDFYSLKNAVTYCIFEQKNKLIEAARVADLDRSLNSLLGEIETHKYLVTKTKDLEKKFIYLSKLSDNQVRKTYLLREMNQLINTSKFLQMKQFSKNNQN